MKKRILVTGGAGFLGSHLCKRLISEGNEVLCLDNFYSGSKDNIVDLLNNPYFEIIRHDVTFPIYIEVDQIYNLACPASPVFYQKYPIQTTKTNVSGAINVLGLAKRLKIPVLQASTSEIYGDPNIHPQTEDYWGNVNCTGIRSCYDEGKRCAETLFFDYHRELGLDIRVARIFNTYGPNMAINDGRVVSNFIVQALNNVDITIYGEGTQTRSLCYVDDLINGFINLMNTPGLHEPINLGNPIEMTIIDIAKSIINLTNSKSKLSFLPLPQDDPLQRCPDISKARNLLNWEPKIDQESGLKKTIDYFRNKLESKT
jgi:UDP-glucuronate decarboxylase